MTSWRHRHVISVPQRHYRASISHHRPRCCSFRPPPTHIHSASSRRISTSGNGSFVVVRRHVTHTPTLVTAAVPC